MNTARPALAAVDWGTTRLRVWLLDQAGAVLAERRSDEGLSVASAQGFELTLERHLGEMQAPPDLPAVICGMAGSRQGWVEAPYVSCPARLADVLAGAVAVPGCRRPIRVIPGIAQRDRRSPDVMRGEETQLAGILDRVASGEHWVCMPGTHSKWIHTRAGALENFSTWLTGELFELLSIGSILRHSVTEAAGRDVTGNDAFRTWFGDAYKAPEMLTGRLFRIRADMLLNGTPAEESAAALSGLLIGCEIGAASRCMGLSGREVHLIASGPLADLYQTALGLAGLDVVLSDADTAVRAGLMQAASSHFPLHTPARRQA